jgi:hypothetical protein
MVEKLNRQRVLNFAMRFAPAIQHVAAFKGDAPD